MVFHPCGGYLILRLVYEYVVAYDILLAVVLVEAGTLEMVHEIVLHEHSGRAFIGVEAPSSVAEGPDIVDNVVACFLSGTGAEGVDATHVTQEAPA